MPGGDAEACLDQYSHTTARTYRSAKLLNADDKDAARARRLREVAQPKLFEGTESTEAAPPAKMMPLIDQVHRLMHLWKAGDVTKVDLYLEDRGLRRSELFRQLLQALIELSPEGSEERSVLESISNHVQARGISRKEEPKLFVEIVEAEEA